MNFDKIYNHLDPILYGLYGRSKTLSGSPVAHVSLARLQHLGLEHRAGLRYRDLLSIWLVPEIHAYCAEMLLERTHAGGGNVRVNLKC